MDTPIANDVRAEPTGSPERPHRAGGGEPVGGPSTRFSAQRKLEAVRRLMRGERYIKIIHGSRNVFRRLEPQISWMEKLAEALACDEVEVRTFRWSGLPHDAFGRACAEKFLRSVLSDIEALNRQGRWKNGDSISIVAKSLGTSIVERAFSTRARKVQELQCDVFLRVAPPIASRSHFAETTVNVSVPWDHLAFGAKIVDRLTTRNGSTEDSGRILNIRLSGLSHKDLNRNVVIPKGEFAGRQLYELYRKLLAREM